MNLKGVQSKLYLLYLFFLPMGRFIDLGLPDTFQKYLLQNFCLFFFYLGGIFILFNKQILRTSLPDIMHKWTKLYIFQVVYSLIAACVLYIPLGTLNGEDTFQASIGGIIFWFIVLCHLYYNYYGITRLITIKQFVSVLHASAFVLLLIGYLQFLVINVGGIFANIYILLSKFIVLLPIERLNRGVVFFGTEPSSSSLVLVYIIPMIISLIIKPIEKNRRWREYLYILLFFPLFITSGSSTVLIMLLILVIATIIIVTKKKVFYKFLLIGSLGIGAIVAFSYGIGNMKKSIGYSADTSSLEYLLFAKIRDTDNLSTMMRSSTIINDMRIFMNFPLLGVGDGLQGYFYNENLPKEFLVSPEVEDVFRGKLGIIDGGGAFFPCFLSAYGILGFIFLIPLIYKYLYFFYKDWRRLNNFDIMLMLFLIVFAVSGWFGLGIRQNFPVILMLILPLASSNLNKLICNQK